MRSLSLPAWALPLAAVGVISVGAITVSQSTQSQTASQKQKSQCVEPTAHSNKCGGKQGGGSAGGGGIPDVGISLDKASAPVTEALSDAQSQVAKLRKDLPTSDSVLASLQEQLAAAETNVQGIVKTGTDALKPGNVSAVGATVKAKLHDESLAVNNAFVVAGNRLSDEYRRANQTLTRTEQVTLDAVQNLKNQVGGAFSQGSGAIDTVVAAYASTYGTASTVPDKAGSSLTNARNTAGSVQQGVSSGADTAKGQLTTGVTNGASTVTNGVQSGADTAVSGVVGGAGTAVGGVTNGAPAVGQGVTGAGQTITGTIQSTGGTVTNSVGPISGGTATVSTNPLSVTGGITVP